MSNNTTKQGAKLEVYVEQLFKDFCKVRVKRNVVYSCRGVLTRRKRRAQIDVEYWDLHGKTIVECKYYNSTNVSLEDVEEFKKRSERVRHNHAIMVTNTDYTYSARMLAKKYGIRIVNGRKLENMSYERLGLAAIVRQRLGRRKSLEEEIRGVDLNKHEYSAYHSSRQYSLL